MCVQEAATVEETSYAITTTANPECVLHENSSELLSPSPTVSIQLYHHPPGHQALRFMLRLIGKYVFHYKEHEALYIYTAIVFQIALHPCLYGASL